ncbi:type VI secretion system baseplate subunit TssE [Erwinia sorbitola]|uniref:Type VI secretion system baseplate subunit TssE n=1 Tax=Erwinia sorbitola TaxID=2681984 RepID=A0ABW9RAM4_9GAMM|nr:type VI secretion system baseplate subunit TssE [Erwinia sorbitola]MTD26536.1 type VI secretion system baseplate subunit TssE [Erwinia sorbitola]
MAALLHWERGSSASLFERIQNKDSTRYTHSRVLELVRSIKRHLNLILNSRPGACQSAAALGIIDLNDAAAGTSDFRKRIEESIRECIENYEPRISAITVNSLIDDGEPLQLSFYISAVVNFDNIEDAVEFTIYLDNNRRYCLNEEA